MDRSDERRAYNVHDAVGLSDLVLVCNENKPVRSAFATIALLLERAAGVSEPGSSRKGKSAVIGGGVHFRGGSRRFWRG